VFFSLLAEMIGFPTEEVHQLLQVLLTLPQLLLFNMVMLEERTMQIIQLQR
jgi:hypothetical protein